MESFESQVKLVSSTKATGLVKLQKLYDLKQVAQQCHYTQDTVYVSLLIDIGRYEFWLRKNYSAAIQNTVDAIAINHTIPQTSTNAVTIQAYGYLAFYYLGINFYNQSLAYNDSIILSKKAPPPVLLLARLNKVFIYTLLEDQQKTNEESIVGLHEAVINKDSLFYLSFLNTKSQSDCFINHLAQARAGAYQALKMAEQYQSFFEQAAALETLAFVYDKEEKKDSAILYFQKALTVRKTDYQSDSLRNTEALTSDYIELGNFYLIRLKDYSHAIINFNKAIDYQKKIKNPLASSYNEAVINLSLGRNNTTNHHLQLAAGFYDKALHHINISTTDFIKNNPSAKQFELTTYKDIGFQIMEEKVKLLLTFFYQTNDSAYLHLAIATSMVVDSVITQIRNEQKGEQSKLTWRMSTRDFYNNAIEACYKANDANKAFFFMERSRAMLLNDKLNELGAAAHLSPKQNNQEEQFQIRLIELQQQLSISAPSSVEYNLIQLLYLQTKKNFEQYTHSLEKTNPVYYQYKYENNTPSLADLQHFLNKNNQSFVHYFVSDSAMYALGITKNKTSFLKISVSNFDARQLSEFINLCSNKEALMNDHTAFSSLAQTIYQKLFQPLNIPKGKVAICTDNFFIPFEALCTDKNGRNYLLYDYNFSYVYSARSLLKTFTHSSPSGNFIGFAPVSFSQSLGVADLKRSASALQDVADFYSSHTLFTEKDATRNSFINQASRYSVVTIFSHAHADTTDAEPVLYMQDSLVHLSDLQRLNNPSIQFVLLSACQTNIGKNATGEGIYSLARGFASIGVPSVSATLWKADEGAVYEISTKFNEYLAKGMNKSEALQKAKIWYLQKNSDNENSLPFYWANMVLIGSSQPIVLTSSNHWWVWVAAAGFIFILSIFFLYKRKNKKQVIRKS